MSAGAYLAGVLWLVAVTGALGFGAVQVRRAALPHFAGSAARLAEITLALAVLVLVPEMLGSVGLFRSVPVLVALVVVGIAAGLVARSTGPHGSAPSAERTVPNATRGSRVVTAVAMVIVAAVGAQWVGHVVAAYGASSAGIWDGDSLWYHLPFATNFVQTGWVTRPLFTNADTLVTYFPANSEIVVGAAMLPFRRDLVVPMVNLGWLALTLLAAWTLGRRFGAPAVAMAGAAVAMSLPVMAATQAGTARNDAMGVALFLTAAALVAHADWGRNAMAVAGAAAGLALGVKLSTLIPVALLAVAVVVAAPRAKRWTATLPWVAGIVVFGAFWYLRNLVLVGNPVPTVGLELGPLRLPSVFAESIEDTAVIDRLTEPGAVGRVLRTGLAQGFGDLWWLVLLAAVAISVVVLLRGPDRIARMLGAVVLAGGLGYVVMPNGSPYGDTDLGAANFMLNLRYVIPVLVLAFALTAALPRMVDARFALGAVVAFAAVTAVTVTDRRFSEQWEWAVSDGQRLVGYLVVAVVSGLAVLVVRLAHRDAPRVGVVIVGTASVAVVAGLAVGFLVQRRYHDHRYATPRAGAEVKVSAVWPWAQGIDGADIGIVGSLLQYPYAGPRLGSTVRYVGVPTDDGGFRPVESCRELVERLTDDEVRYLVAAHDFFGANVREIDRINEWVRALPGTRVVQETDTAWVYELSRSPDARACP